MKAREKRKLIVFLGPSLPLARATPHVPRGTTFLPPARQGDVWRALSQKPAAIALIDGVFEAQPSVWHREILSALAEGVAVFGASSMGALRAAELSRYGMIGVGEIFARYASGDWIDDADVALLHADAEHDFRPLTAPLVNVRFAAEQGVAQGRLSRVEARALVARAEGLFYQERDWPSVLEALPASRREGFYTWLASERVDLKARDAEACLRAASQFVESGAEVPRLSPPTPSALVRRRRRHDSLERGVPVQSVVSALSAQAGAEELVTIGGDALIAQTLGEMLGAGEGEWMAEAPWRLADGPDRDEALEAGAKRSGLWDRLLSELSGRPDRGRGR